MLNKNTEAKAYLSGVPAVLVFTIVLLLGLLVIVLTGCDNLIKQEPFYELTTPQSEYEMHDLTHPLNEYNIENVT
tara:strand:- start:194 stop:418 length:225 start_codon:yes stop_codon:yes gene_type:complete